MAKYEVGDFVQNTKGTILEILEIGSFDYKVRYSGGVITDLDTSYVDEVYDTIYTNQEMIDRIEMAKSINGFVEEKVAASETQVAGNHYSKLKIQPMEYCLQNDLNYGQSNAIKYITRYKDKNGIEDLKKAIHCIELLIEFEEKDID
jgi:hypothetical protein